MFFLFFSPLNTSKTTQFTADSCYKLGFTLFHMEATFLYLQQFGEEHQSGGLALGGGGVSLPPRPQALPRFQHLGDQLLPLSLPHGALPEGVVQHSVQQQAHLDKEGRGSYMIHVLSLTVSCKSGGELTVAGF